MVLSQIEGEQVKIVVLSQIYYTVKILLFTNSKFAKRSFHSTQNYLREFENNLLSYFDNELFCNDTKKFKPKNEDQTKTLNKKKNCN